MRDVPRYSREDFADAVSKLLALRDDLAIGSIARRTMFTVGAMLSEAANRAPTHQELVSGQLPQEELCSIYWQIAVDAVGEDEARRRRDEEIARIVGTEAQA